MRWTLGLAIGLLGCNLLPQKDLSCSEYGSCEPAPPDMTAPPTVIAPFVLGQPDEQTNALRRGLFYPLHVALVGGRLIVSDTSNNRVLIYNQIPTQNNTPPDVVLGQPDFATNVANYGGRSASTLSMPQSVWSDGTHLAVADAGNGRSLFWNTIPTQNGQPANAVWGYPDFTSGNVVKPVDNTRANPGGFARDGNGQFYLVDREAHRVLIFAGIPKGPTDTPTGVLGQSNFTSGNLNAGGTVSAKGLNVPLGVAVSPNNNLWLVDSINHRVVGWKPLPPATGLQDATLLLGQSMFTSATLASPSAHSLNGPSGVAFSPTSSKMAVVDTRNSRILLWNTEPLTLAQDADVVVGQSVFGSMGQAVRATGLIFPAGVAVDEQRLVVADSYNNRVLIYNPIPTVSGAAANIVLGQPTMNDATALGALPVSDSRMYSPAALASVGGQLYVADSRANRVLVYADMPTAPSQRPVAVLGQGGFSDALPNLGTAPQANGLHFPQSIAGENGALAIADTGNNRVLLWNKAPRAFGTPPDLLLGQPNATSKGVGADSGLSSPVWVHLSGERIYVVDSDNNRVLIWKQLPTANMQKADIVLGQADFSGMQPNRGTSVAANGLSGPTAVFADGSRIYVSDSGNSRVLVWNSLDPVSGQNADLVLGKTAFNDGMRPASASAGNIGSAAGILVDGERLYIVDAGFNRILIWNSIPMANGQAANQVFGQPNLTSGVPNQGGIGTTTLSTPKQLIKTAAGIYIADSANGRVLALRANAF